MVESACLVRSFLQPNEISCHGAHEGDPVRALTESISFGRFMSESLAWEKWSTFSHNRYLEEIGKFAKPGSVAKKKAFFEAHYKKRAAMKAAAQKTFEEVTIPVHVTSKAESESETQKDTAINSEAPLMVMNTGEVVDEERQVMVSGNEADCAVDVNSDSSISKMDKTTTVVEDCEPKDLNMEKSNSAENLKQIEKVVNHFEIACTDDKMQNEGNSASQGKGTGVSSFSGSKAQGGRQRSTFSGGRESDSSIVKTGNDTSSSSDKVVVVSKKQKRSMAESFHPSISSISSSSGKSNNQLILMPQNNPRTRSRNSTKPVGELDNKKKRPLPSSLHMSINVASTHQTGGISWKTPRNSIGAKVAGEAEKKKKRSIPSSVHKLMNFASSPCLLDKTSQTKRTRSSTTQEATSSKAEKIASPRDKASTRAFASQKNTIPIPSIHMSINLGSHAGQTSKILPRTAKDDLNSANCSTRASMIGISKRPPRNRPSEDKRKNTFIGSSISGTTLNSPKMQYPANRGKLTSPSGTSTRSSTVFSPFSFRSAERAEKRKEFFKKLEEKNKGTEAVKEQMPTRSKIPLTWPNSPKLSKNQTLVLTNIRSSHQPPQKLSSANTISCSDLREKNKHKKIHPSNLLPKKKTHENLSPNIQR